MRPEVELISAVSRLLDLHDSQKAIGVASTSTDPPRTDENSSPYYLEIALRALDFLREFEHDDPDDFYPKSAISDKIKSSFPKATDNDIDYCLRVLSQARKVHYFPGGSLKSTHTQNTRLLDRPRGDYDQYKLTEIARLLFKVSALKSNWLYEDQDAEKIIRAIENNNFDDVTRFCDERSRSIDDLSRLLTKIEERAISFNAVFATFSEFEKIKESFDNAFTVIGKALKMLRSDPLIEDRFAEWSERTRNEGFSLSNVIHDCHTVNQSLDRAIRRLTNFVKAMKSRQLTAVGVTDFLAIAESFVFAAPSKKAQEELLTSILPLVEDGNIFSPLDFSGAVDLSDYTSKEQPDFAIIDMANLVEEERQYMSEFLLRNRDWVINRLKQKPLTLQEILYTGEFVIRPGESLADFFGVYSVTDEFGGEIKVCVGISGDKCAYRDDRLSITGDNPILFLLEGI